MSFEVFREKSLKHPENKDVLIAANSKKYSKLTAMLEAYQELQDAQPPKPAKGVQVAGGNLQAGSLSETSHLWGSTERIPFSSSAHFF